MDTYKHTVQYYETDKMGITHHSNYIRWMEEARVYFLKQIGWGFSKMEAEGISSPVISVNCKYKAPSYFEDEISILVFVKEVKGLKLYIQYIMMNEEGKVICEGNSEHAFFKGDKVLRLDTDLADFYEALIEHSADSPSA